MQKAWTLILLVCDLISYWLSGKRTAQKKRVQALQRVDQFTRDVVAGDEDAVSKAIQEMIDRK